MLLSAVSVFVVAQSSSEIPEGLMNNPVLSELRMQRTNVTGKTKYTYVPDRTIAVGAHIFTGY